MQKTQLTSNKLKKLVKIARHCNIAPIFLPRYVDAEHPVSSLLKDLINETLVFLKRLSEDEIRAVNESLPPGLSMMVDLPSSKIESIHLKRLATYIVVAEVQKQYLSFKKIIKSNLNDSEVLNIYPELEHDIDEDGLLILSEKFKLYDGGIEYKDHILHYHQLLRRSYRANPNFDFLGRFISYFKKTNEYNIFRIAIDYFRIMPKNLYEQIAEFDTWYGPPFDEDKIDDKKYVGLTVIKRNKNSLFELTNKLDRTEFFWSYRDNIKTFQIEEISDTDYVFENYIFNRYIHSERDTIKKKFCHLDGAVKVYLQDQYEARFLSNMPGESKCYKKIKLWRVDGDIELSIWIPTFRTLKL